MDSGANIAVIGASCAFPGAADPDKFWENIVSGTDSLTLLSAADLEAAGEHPEVVSSARYVRVAACMDDADLFDAAFFGLTPQEALTMDPQHRLFLEHSWRALEVAGYDPRNAGCPVGVYAGEGINTYVHRVRAAADAEALHRQGLRVEGVGGIGNDLDFLTTRVSYELNLTGPSLPIATACSSSLVAVHLACQALRTYECDMALAGGVAVTPPLRRGYLHVEGGILAADGCTRPFDARSSGTVLGSGVGVLTLKRWEDAQQDGDSVIGIIRGTAINNDGAARAGFTAPGIDGQAEVIAMAQAVAEIHPDTVTYVEAHGTATRVGDPIEVAALTRAFREHTDRRGYCVLGSVKANIGHMDAAAGVAGLIKALYAAKNGVYPPQINFNEPNPALALDESPFRIITQAEPWRTPAGVPRRAGVSSFGFGGTNAHVVIEQPPHPGPPAAPTSVLRLLPVSALDEAGARAALSALGDHLGPEPALADAAHTLQKGRARFPVRAAVAARTTGEAVVRLRERAHGRFAPVHGAARPVFLFPGQGTQYLGMAAGLYRDLPVFAAEFDRLAAGFRPLIGLDLRTIVFDRNDSGAGRGLHALRHDLDQTRLSQPALFAVEYALARVLMAAGAEPAAMLGHSIGELVAAALAGVWRFEDALRVVDARARLMQAAPAGAMAALRLPASEVMSLLRPGISIAAVNASDNTVVSGDPAALADLTATLADRGVPVRPLRVSHGYHSALMDSAAAEFTRFMVDVPASAPGIPYLSNLTGTWVAESDVRDPGYWGRHLRHAVRFAAGLATLADAADGPWVHVGPGRTCLNFARGAAPGSERTLIATLDHAPDGRRDDTASLGAALATLWESGVDLDFDGWAGATGRRVPLPTYPFQRRRYWMGEAPAGPRAGGATVRDAGAALARDQHQWLYAPTWRETAPAALDRSDAAGVPVTLIARPGPLRDALAAGLQVGRAGVAVLDPSQIDAWTPPEGPSLIVFADGMGEITDNALQIPARGDAHWTLITLTRRLAPCRGGRHELIMVTNGAFDVLGTERLAPDRALLAGLGKVLPKELAHVSCRVVDVDLAAGVEQIAAGITAETAVARPAAITAHRGARRWTQQVTRLRVPEPALAEARLRYRGVYLITGGYGGIGLSLAGFLSRRCRARLVLVGRSKLPEAHDWDAWIAARGTDDPVSQKIAALRRLAADGAEVLPLCADVSDEESIAGAVQMSRAHFGHLDGVIHAAGAAGDGLLHTLDEGSLDRVLHPKVMGTQHLWRAIGSEPVDFFALFSSLSTVDAWDGTGAYTAANSYLDAFAHWAHRQGRTDVLAIDWTGWWDLGMNRRPDRSPAGSAREPFLTEDEGHAVFLRALSVTLPQVHVSVHDLTEMHARGERISLHLPAPAATGSAAMGTGPGPAVPVPREPISSVGPGSSQPRSAVEAFLCDAFSAVLGFAEVGRDDNFFTLGGDSLTALDLLARVRGRYPTEVLLQEFFADPTPGGIAGRIDGTAPATDHQEATQ